MSDLVFQLPAGGADLVFGAEGAGIVVGAVDATLQAALPVFSFSAKLIPNSDAVVAASMPVFSFSAVANYTSYASRPIVGRTAAAWQRAEGFVSGAQAGFSEGDAAISGADFAWQEAALLSANWLSEHQNAQRVQQRRASNFSGANRLSALSLVSQHQDGQRDRRLSSRSRCQTAARLPGLVRSSRHQDALRTSRSMRASVYQEAGALRQMFGALFGVGAPFTVCAQSPGQNTIRPPAGICVKPTEPATPGVGPTAHLLFYLPWDGTAALLFGDDGESAAATIIVPIRRRYIVINTQSLMRVSDGLAIPASDINVSIDADSWAWGWSASVPGAYMDALQAEVGNLVELEARVNGHAFRLSVENIQRDRSFGKSALSISGRSRAAWLADPYAEVVNRANTTQMTAQQLMALALTENGASLGWDIDWQITDWVVPAGVWSHSGTAIEACLSIADAAGAYIQSDPVEQVLRVLPRYPAAPWNWGDLTPDIDLPEDVCVTEGLEFVEKPTYNTVFVSGQAQGVLGHVTRSGTDGGRASPMVTDPLITHADAARQRGIAELSDTGRQKLITLSLPVLEETGIILPGKLIRYTESGKTHLGLSRSLGLSAKFPKIRQTISVVSHVL